MSDKLGQDLEELKKRLPTLERKRYESGFLNSVFELTDDLCRVADRALNHDTTIDFTPQANYELGFWNRLRIEAEKQSQADRLEYQSVYDLAQQILREMGKVVPPQDGHLGVLRIIREEFAFLHADFGFTAETKKPTGMRFSSGSVYVNLEYAKRRTLSCSFGPESNLDTVFGIADLLFLFGDQGYKEPEEITLATEKDVESWFKYLADVFKRYGQEILTNEPGIFDKLTTAQNEKDQEYIRQMDERYGNRK
jgi:hypothetical protein